MRGLWLVRAMPVVWQAMVDRAAVAEGGHTVAKRVIHRLIDDLDGQPAYETIIFGLDGAHYEIDLSASNAEQLRRAVAPFVAGATKIGRGPLGALRDRAAARGAANTGASTPRRTAQDRERLAQIRTWAQANGHQIKDRGRIPADVITAYEQTQQSPPEPTTPPKRTRPAKTIPQAQFTAP